MLPIHFRSIKEHASTTSLLGPVMTLNRQTNFDEKGEINTAKKEFIAAQRHKGNVLVPTSLYHDSISVAQEKLPLLAIHVKVAEGTLRRSVTACNFVGLVSGVSPVRGNISEDFIHSDRLRFLRDWPSASLLPPSELTSVSLPEALAATP